MVENNHGTYRDEDLRHDKFRDDKLRDDEFRYIINQIILFLDFMNRQLFPLGKAYGKAFCNRVAETAQLVGNIQSNKHSLLIAPRRFGKSSLAERTIEAAGFPNIKINFHLCTSEEDVTQLIIKNTIDLIGKAIGSIDKLMASVQKYLSNLEPLLMFGNKVASLRLEPKKHANNAVIIAEALLLIENLLREKNKRAVLFFDEFQEIAKISKNYALEGAIRTAAQEMQHLSIIFSGSVRSLLMSMFEDEARPLYKLCRKIKLERIEAIDYEKHIQAIAAKTWGSKLEKPVFERLMHLSNRHPYYVNYLCDSLWERCKNLPSITDVVSAWEKVVIEEWSDALKELSDLPLGQRKLLKFIATNRAENLQTQEVCSLLSMPPSSIGSAIHVLLEKDYIEKGVDCVFYVINPLLITVLQGAVEN